MNKSIAVILVKGCFVRIEIAWEDYSCFQEVARSIATRLGGEFLYEETIN